MKIISIIPARGGSKGIPMKNLVPLNGKPLLYYTVSASLNSSAVSRTVVSTDNEKIANYAQSMGVEVVYRPKRLSGDTVRLEPVIFHLLNHFRKNENYMPDTIVTLQNTSPFRNAKHIDKALSLFKRGGYDSVISGFKSKFLLWKKKGKYVIPINYDPIMRPRRQEIKKYFIENGAIYITKYSSLQKFNSRVCGKVGLYQMPQELSIEIDSYSDLFLAKQIFKHSKQIL